MGSAERAMQSRSFLFTNLTATPKAYQVPQTSRCWKHMDHLYTHSRVVEGSWESLSDNLVPQWVPVECAPAVWSTLHASMVPLCMPYVPCLLGPRLRLTPPATSWTFSLVMVGHGQGSTLAFLWGKWSTHSQHVEGAMWASSRYELQLFLEWFTDDQCLQI